MILFMFTSILLNCLFSQNVGRKRRRAVFSADIRHREMIPIQKYSFRYLFSFLEITRFHAKFFRSLYDVTNIRFYRYDIILKIYLLLLHLELTPESVSQLSYCLRKERRKDTMKITLEMIMTEFCKKRRFNICDKL